MRYRLGFLFIAASLFALVVAACSDSGDATAPEPTVTTVTEASPTQPSARPTDEPVAEEEEEEEKDVVFGETVIAPEGQRSTEVLLLIPVALHIGQKLASPSLVSGLTIDFVEVVEDSRCPTGAECITAGTVTVRIKTASGTLDTGDTTLILEAGQTEPTVKKLSKFSAVFISLEPYPVAGETIDPADYVGTFAVLE